MLWHPARRPGALTAQGREGVVSGSAPECFQMTHGIQRQCSQCLCQRSYTSDRPTVCWGRGVTHFSFHKNHNNGNKNWKNSSVMNINSSLVSQENFKTLPERCSWRPLFAKGPARRYLWLLGSQRAEQNLQTRVKREFCFSRDKRFCRTGNKPKSKQLKCYHAPLQCKHCWGGSRLLAHGPLQPARRVWRTATLK